MARSIDIDTVSDIINELNKGKPSAAVAAANTDANAKVP